MNLNTSCKVSGTELLKNDAKAGDLQTFCLMCELSLSFLLLLFTFIVNIFAIIEWYKIESSCALFIGNKVISKNNCLNTFFVVSYFT